MHYNVKDMAGQKFGKLLILEYVEVRDGHAYWLCKCDCGNEKIIDGSTIRRGHIKSCGCLGKVTGLEGKNFGRLLVIEKTETKDRKTGSYFWKCLCDCGNEVNVISHSLKTGNTQSCGCLQKEATSKPTGESAFTTLYESYRKRSETYNIVFNLSRDDFKNLTSKNCFYCNCAPYQVSGRKANGQYLYNGLDKIVPSKGYVLDNVVPCCGDCNRSKYTRSQEYFYEWIDNVYNNIHRNILKDL